MYRNAFFSYTSSWNADFVGYPECEYFYFLSNAWLLISLCFYNYWASKISRWIAVKNKTKKNPKQIPGNINNPLKIVVSSMAGFYLSLSMC